MRKGVHVNRNQEGSQAGRLFHTHVCAKCLGVSRRIFARRSVWIPAGILFLLWISALSSCGQVDPSVAYGAENWLVVWSGDYAGGDSVYGMRVAQDGELLDTVAFLIHPGGNGAYPDVAFDGENWGVVARRLVGGGLYGIDFVRVGQEGDVLDSPSKEICTGSVASQSISFGDSCYLVVWLDYSLNEIRASRVAPSGGVLDPLGFTVCTGGGSPDIAFDGTNWLVVWQDSRNGTSNTDIYGALISSSGAVLGPGEVPICTSPGRQLSPSVSYGAGRYLVVWNDERMGSWDSYGSFVTPVGEVVPPGDFCISDYYHSPSTCFGLDNWLTVMERPHSSFVTPRIHAYLVESTSLVVPLDVDYLGLGGGWAPFSIAYGETSWLAVWCSGTNWSSNPPNIVGRIVDETGELLAAVKPSKFLGCRTSLYSHDTTDIIGSVPVGESFDICVEAGAVGDQPESVRFMSDESQDGSAQGDWTDWYEWTSATEHMTLSWSFATSGQKEVWAEVRFASQITCRSSANIEGVVNQSPMADAGPDQTIVDVDGNGSESVALDGSGSYDPDGDIVSWVWTEDVSQIGAGETPTVTLPVGTHTLTLTVTDDDGSTDTDDVVIAVIALSAHTVSVPTTPSGPSSGQVGAALPFSTGGSTCSQGHSVQYQFDWGDGTAYSSWSSAATASHSYAAAGTYQVKARVRCSQDTSIVSVWSSGKTVAISTTPVVHTVSVPTTPSGPSSGQVGATLSFSTGGSTCSQGHSVQYQFDWDNGNYSDWSSSASTSYSYSSSGTYQVKAQARCASDTSVVSNWSGARTVVVDTIAPSLGTFEPGDLVRATRKLNVRNDENEDVGDVFAGYGGTIEGPSRIREVDDVEYVFWKIRWGWKLSETGADILLGEDEGIIGWTAEGFLAGKWLLTDDVYWLAKALTNEARGQDELARRAVGYTVLNRLEYGSEFGSNIHGVVIASNGYAPSWGKPHREPTNADIVGSAKSILEGEVSDPTGGATHFFSPMSQVGTTKHPVPGTATKAYYAWWAEPIGGWDVLTDTLMHYVNIDNREWRPLEGISTWEFMFYRPYTTRVTAAVGSPVELRVIDSEGRITGLVDGEVLTEIPDSAYNNETVTILFPLGFYQYEIEGQEHGSYGLAMSAYTRDGNIDFTANDIMTEARATHRYSFQWDLLARNREGVTIEIDQDGDGTFEQTITAGGELTGDEIDVPDVVPAAKAVSNGPNPVTSAGTAFFFSLPESTLTAKLMVFTVAGRAVFDVSLDVDSERFPETGRWDPVDQDGIPLANGPYVYVLIADGRVIGQGKMVIQR